jgi:hypothetical protein
MVEKGVHFFGMWRMNEKEILKLGLLCGLENLRAN